MTDTERLDFIETNLLHRFQRGGWSLLECTGTDMPLRQYIDREAGAINTKTKGQKHETDRLQTD
jgi:hypothetical protein